jgi:formylglycine-generating enzyme required for sulfatase activity
MGPVRFSWIAAATVLILAYDTSGAASIQRLTGHVPSVVSELGLRPICALPSSNQLNLAISLPLRNHEQLIGLLQQIYDPMSPNYRHFLTPRQFTENFGPTERDYQALIAFAHSNGLAVNGEHANRMLLDVVGSVDEVEKAFHLTMQVYNHPTENRTFYAADTEPSFDLGLPILHIHGLDNFNLPCPMGVRVTPIKIPGNQPHGAPMSLGAYSSSDLRTAYAPGVSLTGAGQAIGLVEFDGYYTNDIARYERSNGLSGVLVTNVLINGFDGLPSAGAVEPSLDIDMAIAMAPGAKIITYEASENSNVNIIDMFNRMAIDDLARQLSSSWSIPFNEITIEQICEEFSAQGQAFFQSSGDDGAFPDHNTDVIDAVTIVGGTLLEVGADGWFSEVAWGGSGGDYSTNTLIPTWQKGINMVTNHGSTIWRNFPDVAMVAFNVWFAYANGLSGGGSGTSASAPLWAGFAALVNQQAATFGGTAIGSFNPAIYAIGKGSNYGAAFHDIKTGNNTNSLSPTNYFAVSGYDLCTGWGTPSGYALIDLLTMPPHTDMAPVLTVTRLGTNLILNWTLYASEFTLQTATDLSPSVVWTPVLSNRAMLSGQYAISDPTSSPQRFYQLRQIDMALIPAGSFTMGDGIGLDSPKINVSVSAFYIDTNLVSNGLWLSVYGWALRRGYSFVNIGSGQDSEYPVQTIDWYDAVKWCNARSQQFGLSPVYYTDAAFTQLYTNGETDAVFPNWSNNGYRLPTEAEWEKAARGGLNGQRFPWGNTISESQANYHGDTNDYVYDVGPTGYNAAFTVGVMPYTSPVGSFASNGFGLCDMSGNLFEWCWDWYDNYGQPPVPDPTGPSSGTDRVLRGGSWFAYANSAGCANRNWSDPSRVNFTYGFRCARRQ